MVVVVADRCLARDAEWGGRCCSCLGLKLESELGVELGVELGLELGVELGVESGVESGVERVLGLVWVLMGALLLFGDFLVWFDLV